MLDDAVYDERMLAALDWIIAAARIYKLKLIFPFTDFWAESGGIASILLLARKLEGLSFLSDTSILSDTRKEMFTSQDCFSFILNIFVVCSSEKIKLQVLVIVMKILFLRGNS